VSFLTQLPDDGMGGCGGGGGAGWRWGYPNTEKLNFPFSLKLQIDQEDFIELR